MPVTGEVDQPSFNPRLYGGRYARAVGKLNVLWAVDLRDLDLIAPPNSPW